MLQINTKSIARIAAIQTFYDYENTNEDQNINSSLMRIIEYYKSGAMKDDLEMTTEHKFKIEPRYNFLDELVKFTYGDIKTIDNTIEQYLTNEWTISKLSHLLLAVLRVAVGEITYYPETPTRVIISEYTDIASDLLDENEVGFVNSILENCARKIRP